MTVTRTTTVLLTVCLLTLGTVAPMATASENRTTSETIKHDLTASFSGVPADGSTQTVYVTMPDPLAGGVSVDSARVTSGSASVTGTTLVDGPDGDGVTETVAVDLEATGGGSTDVTLSLSVTGTYPDDAGGSIGVDDTGVRYAVDETDPLVQAIVEREGGTIEDVAVAPALLSVTPPGGGALTDLSLTVTRTSDGTSLAVPLERLADRPTLTQPGINVSTTSLSFADSDTQTVTITNTGDVPLSVPSPTLEGNDSAFDVDVESGALAVGAERTVTVEHTGSGGENATLTVGTNTSASATVALTGPPAETDPGPTIETTTTGTDERRNTQVSMRGMQAGQETTANVDISDENVTIETLSVTTKRDGNLNLTVESGSEMREEIPDLNTSDKAILNAFVVNHSVSNDELSQAGLTVRVDRERVEALETTDPEDVVLYRHGEDGWVETNTTLLESTEEYHRYFALGEGYSEWATAGKQADFRITETSVNVSSVRAGESVTVSVRISNNGGADGQYLAELILDDVVVDDRRIDIAAGGTGQVNFERELTRSGTYEVQVNDVLVDEVQVAAANGSDGAADGSDGSDGGSGPPLVLVGGVVVLIVGLGIVGYVVRS